MEYILPRGVRGEGGVLVGKLEGDGEGGGQGGDGLRMYVET